MQPPILTTKLIIPPLRSGILTRARLIERLDQGGAHQLTLISAPAGFGKTTLLAEWAASTPRPTAWLSLDAADNDPARFFAYLIAAVQTLQSDFGEQTALLLQDAERQPLEVLLIHLINELAAFPQDFNLVLDDYHLISEPRLNELVAYLIEHLPRQMQLIIATRSDPALPLALYRARGLLQELRSRDLRFTQAEAAEFLQRASGMELTPQDVAALEARTEGWIAGLQLAALSLPEQPDVPAFVQAFTGSHLYVAEYLVSEVLQRQPPEVRDFLLQTSILTRLNAGLCEAVSGCPDSQGMLQKLHHENLFMVALDHEARWFRYHHLFADLLQTRLQQQSSPAELAALQLKAAAWYASQGFLEQAIEHALAAPDAERAAEYLDQAAAQMGFTEQYRRLAGWLQALPESAFQTHPRLEIYRLMIELSQGTLDMYEATLREKEKLIQALPSSPENDRLRLEALVYLSSFYAHQNTQRAIEIARAAQPDIPASEPRLQAMLYSTLYRAYGMQGDIAQSAPAYRESLRQALAAEAYGMIANTTMVRAFDLCQYGRLDEGAHYCREILAAGEAAGRKVFYPAGVALIGLGGIHLERYELEQAAAALQEGLELCLQGAQYGLYTGYIQWARLQQAQGNLSGAAATLLKLEQMLQRRDFTLSARQVSLRLAQGDIAGAARLAEPLETILGASDYSQELPLIAAEAFKLCLARIRLAEGKLAAALRLLDEIEPTVTAGQRDGRLMEVHLLRALAARQAAPDQASGQPPPVALDHLQQALELAEPAGMRLLILEEGPPVAALLGSLASRQTTPENIRQYARGLLLALDSGETPLPPVGPAAPELVEQLTPREREVLELLADGDSNQAIAEKLFISVRTVKKHNSNIYGKLQVSSRTQAVARARELGLLDSHR